MTYSINFSTNAAQAIRDIQRINQSIGDLGKLGQNIQINVNTTRLSGNIKETFRQLNTEIGRMEAKLSKLQIGSKAFTQMNAAIGYRQGRVERGQMIGEPLRLRGQAQAFGEGTSVRLSKELQAAQVEASQLAPNTAPWIELQQQIGRINTQLQQSQQLAQNVQMRESLGAFAPGSLAALETRLTILKNSARNISPDTQEWREFDKQIQKTEKAIEKINKKPLGTSQRLGAAGGAFLYGGGLGGGAGSALGGIAGGLLGGVPGAFTGAAVGQFADNLGQQAAGVAKLVAEVNKSKIALAGVSTSFADYYKSVDAATKISSKFLLPVGDGIRQFTKLKASVVGAGFTTDTTIQAFNGIAAAIVATGGSTEDLNGALLATSQVFSKGKVSAEELRGQIGERLAGAFTTFAKSIAKTPQELDDLLGKGQVSLKDFIKFIEELNKKYGTTAEILAKAPENAGARLSVALQTAALTYGGFFQQVGAGFQSYATDLVNFAIANKDTIAATTAQFVVLGQDLYTILSSTVGRLVPVFESFFSYIFNNFAKGINALARFASETKAAAGGAEQRAAKAVEALYPNPIERAFKGAKAYKEALAVELNYDKKTESTNTRLKKLQSTLFRDFKPTQAMIGGGTQGTGMSSDLTGGKKKEGRSKKERESQAAQLQLELDLSKEQFALDLQMISAQLTSNTLEQNRIEGAKKILDLQYQIKGVKLEQIPEDEKQLKIAKLQGAIEAARAQNNAKLALAMTQETKTIEENIKKIVQGYQQELQEKQRYAELLSQGVAPALAKVYIEIERAFKEQKEQLKVQIGIAETAIIELEAKKDLTDEEKKRLGVLKDQLKARKDLSEDADKGEKGSKDAAAQTQARPSIATTLTEGLDAARQKLADLMDVGKLVVNVAQTIGEAFGNAFKGLISGSMSAKEALASIFQSIADSFVDMVGQMIAAWLQTQLLKGFQAIFSAFTGGIGGGGGGLSDLNAPVSPTNPLGVFANGGIAQGGFRAFASGGVVSGPTLGLVGEGRYNEAVIPLPDGKSVPVDLGGAMGGASGDISTNIVINVSNGQMQDDKGGGNASSLGRKIEGAVKQVLVNELRPGGVLSSRR
jgi:tape measure domain-containing protein